MRNYNVVTSKLGFYLRKEKDGRKYVLWKNKQRTTDTKNVLIFFHKDKAESALVIMRIKDEWKKPG